MKFISVLFLTFFFLVSCGKKQAESSSDEQVSQSDDQKYALVVVTEGDIPKCWVSLEGRDELVPSFAEAYPVGHPVYSKKLVSSAKTEGMTAEELANAVVVPPVVADLPNCTAEDEVSVSQSVSSMVLTDGREEEVAGVGEVLLGNVITCVGAYGLTWGLRNWYAYGYDLKNLAVAGIGAIFAIAPLGYSNTELAKFNPFRYGIVRYSLGTVLCGAAGTTTGFVFLSDHVEGTRLEDAIEEVQETSERLLKPKNPNKSLGEQVGEQADSMFSNPETEGK